MRYAWPCLIIKSKKCYKEGSVLEVLEDFPHAVELAYTVELGDAAQVKEAVEAHAEVD